MGEQVYGISENLLLRFLAIRLKKKRTHINSTPQRYNSITHHCQNCWTPQNHHSTVTSVRCHSFPLSLTSTGCWSWNQIKYFPLVICKFWRDSAMKINWILNKHESWEISTKTPSVFLLPQLFSNTKKIFVVYFSFGEAGEKGDKIKGLGRAWGLWNRQPQIPLSSPKDSLVAVH